MSYYLARISIGDQTQVAKAKTKEDIGNVRADQLRDEYVQDVSMENAEFFISAGLGLSRAYVTKDFHGLNTVVAPVVWNPGP